jgi:hypothetical protein
VLAGGLMTCAHLGGQPSGLWTGMCGAPAAPAHLLQAGRWPGCHEQLRAPGLWQHLLVLRLLAGQLWDDHHLRHWRPTAGAADFTLHTLPGCITQKAASGQGLVSPAECIMLQKGCSSNVTLLTDQACKGCTAARFAMQALAANRRHCQHASAYKFGSVSRDRKPAHAYLSEACLLTQPEQNDRCLQGRSRLSAGLQ